MTPRPFFRFHLTTLFVATLLASGVVYLNFRDYRTPHLGQSITVKGRGTKWVMNKDGKCVPEKVPGETRYLYYLQRCYVEDIGWPYTLWPSQGSYTTPMSELNRSTKYEIDKSEWDKYDIGSCHADFNKGLMPYVLLEESVLKRAPHLSEKIQIRANPVIHRRTETNFVALAWNIGVGLLIVLLPAAAVEILLRRRVPFFTKEQPSPTVGFS